MLIRSNWGRMEALVFGLHAMVICLAAREAAALGQTPDAQRQNQPRVDKLDSYGDPLPPGAVARLGTARFHAGGLINQAFFASSDKAIVTVDWKHAVYVWDAASGQILRRIGDSDIDFREIAVSSDGKT